MEETEIIETEEDQEEIERWKSKREKLNQHYIYDSDWEFVINIFEERITEKFLKPLKSLIDERIGKGSGFSIVAIECLLIEVFAAFRKGGIFNYSYDENCPSFQYKDSKKLYVEFLTTVSPFNSQFVETRAEANEENNIFSAIDFYKYVRCGLLHEGKTKDKWTINLKPRSEPPKIFLGKDKEKFKIYRTLFHKKLNSYFSNYIKELKGLKGEEKQNKNLRRNFARKMDNLYNIPRDRKFDWWKDTKPARSILQIIKTFLRKKLKISYKYLDDLLS